MGAQADAVDSAIAPVHSFLPPGVNVAAQALLTQPELRGMRATDLARLLSVSNGDARAGIGAVIGMINRTARGAPESALRLEPSLGIAVGPFMSLDQAMSRYGVGMGPIVRGPSPSPLWSGPDVGADRQYGAGALDTGAGRSHGARGHSGPGDYGEAGSISADLESAAQMMISYLQGQGCGPDATIGDFQTTYNASYSPSLAVDRKYGPATRAALVQVLADSQQVTGAETLPNGLTGLSAPAACSYPGPAPAATTTSPTTSPGGSAVSLASLGGSKPWLWGLAALVAGGVLLSQSKHPPRWARKLGLHRRARR